MAKARSTEPLSPEERIAQAYRNTFTSESGQVVLDDLRKAYGRRKSFLTDKPDPYLTAFREGERSVYLRIMDYIDPKRIDEEETQ